MAGSCQLLLSVNTDWFPIQIILIVNLNAFLIQKPRSHYRPVVGISDTSGGTKYRNSEYFVVALSQHQPGMSSAQIGCLMYGLYIKVLSVQLNDQGLSRALWACYCD